MAASVFDSAHLRGLFGDPELSRLTGDSAEIRAMLIVEGALAKVQGKLGVIPELSAAAIHRATLEIQLDAGGLAAETAQNGVVIPALVSAFRKEMQAPEHAQYLHFGATSQDIIDTAQALRLRQVIGIYRARLSQVLSHLGALANEHADTPMPARTWGQHATPTTFGAICAAWGDPLLALLDDLERVEHGVAVVSLSGAAGTAGALGPKAAETRAALAEALSLRDPGHSWHSDRSGIAALGAWQTQVTAQIGKIGSDLTALTQTELAEIHLGGAGASSTMPQKQNPVQPAVLVALAGHTAALNTALQGAAVHQHQRDGAAWMTEWLSLPQMVIATGRALIGAAELMGTISPRADRMAKTMDLTQGLIHAEALSFALCAAMPRPEAQAVSKELCQQAMATETHLSKVVAERFPDMDMSAVFDVATQLGQAPDDAKSFATRVNSL
ncbi:lyase family protein [Shimia ponticola]|uniref:lyase family protein n=1 Tax=Shimia ponticola TaxID=2582893 RepID=UPI0011BE2B88|nr:lyase family protein [Shimia ponticola]